MKPPLEGGNVAIPFKECCFTFLPYLEARYISNRIIIVWNHHIENSSSLLVVLL